LIFTEEFIGKTDREIERFFKKYPLPGAGPGGNQTLANASPGSTFRPLKKMGRKVEGKSFENEQVRFLSQGRAVD
jgi:hypothetical protein